MMLGLYSSRYLLNTYLYSNQIAVRYLLVVNQTMGVLKLCQLPLSLSYPVIDLLAGSELTTIDKKTRSLKCHLQEAPAQNTDFKLIFNECDSDGLIKELSILSRCCYTRFNVKPFSLKQDASIFQKYNTTRQNKKAIISSLKVNEFLWTQKFYVKANLWKIVLKFFFYF